MKIEPAIVPYWDLENIKNLKKKTEIVDQFGVILVREFLKEAEKSLPKSFFDSFSSKMYRDFWYMELSQIVGSNLGKNFEKLFEEALKTYGGLNTE
jgi:Rod binding domain-containing protein